MPFKPFLITRSSHTVHLGAVGVGLVGKVGSARAGGEARSSGSVAGLLAQGSVSARSKSASGQQLLAIAGVVVVLLALLGLAAADSEDPEETGTETESSANPDDGKEFAVKVDLGTVERLGALDNTGNDGSGGSGKRASNDDKDGGDDRFKPRQAGDSPREI